MAGWWCPRLVEGQFLVGQVPGMPNARRSACHRAGALGQGQAPPPGHSPRGPQVRLCPGPGWPWCPRPPWGSGPPCHAWVSPSSKARGRPVNPLPSPGLWGSYVSLPDPWDSRPSPRHVPSESGPAPPCPARTFPPGPLLAPPRQLLTPRPPGPTRGTEVPPSVRPAGASVLGDVPSPLQTQGPPAPQPTHLQHGAPGSCGRRQRARPRPALCAQVPAELQGRPSPRARPGAP